MCYILVFYFRFSHQVYSCCKSWLCKGEFLCSFYLQIVITNDFFSCQKETIRIMVCPVVFCVEQEWKHAGNRVKNIHNYAKCRLFVSVSVEQFLFQSWEINEQAHAVVCGRIFILNFCHRWTFTKHSNMIFIQQIHVSVKRLNISSPSYWGIRLVARELAD